MSIDEEAYCLQITTTFYWRTLSTILTLASNTLNKVGEAINTQVTNSTSVVKDFSLSLLAANNFIFIPFLKCNIRAWGVFCSHQLWALRVNYLPLLKCVVDEVTWHGTRPPFLTHPSPALLPVDDPFRIYNPAVVLHISCQGVTDPFANLDFTLLTGAK